MLYFHSVTVSGSGQFPVDMLRKDKCFPKSEPDSNVIQRDGERSVTLEKITDLAHWSPTFGRWESFGWKVVAWEFTDSRGRRCVAKGL